MLGSGEWGVGSREKKAKSEQQGNEQVASKVRKRSLYLSRR